jgi:predicted small secreted protein
MSRDDLCHRCAACTFCVCQIATGQPIYHSLSLYKAATCPLLFHFEDVCTEPKSLCLALMHLVSAVPSACEALLLLIVAVPVAWALWLECNCAILALGSLLCALCGLWRGVGEDIAALHRAARTNPAAVQQATQGKCMHNYAGQLLQF